MKILVIGPSWVGDMMISQSLYRLLVQRYPDAQIDVMAPAWCRPLLSYMPEVNQALEMSFGHGALALGERHQLGKALRQSGYHQALVLPNSFKSALVPFFAGIPQRIGWRGEMRYGLLNDIRTLDKQAFPLMVQCYTALAFDRQGMRSAADLPTPLPWPRLTVSTTDIDLALHTFVPEGARALIGFCPGAEFGGPAKRWPHYHYAALATALIRRGYQIALFGSTRDQAAGEAIGAALPEDCRCHCYNLVGKTSLEQAIALIAACQGIVSNDSGLMHVASALDRPLVALYGPSSPDFTPPLSHQARVIRLISGYHKIRKNEQCHHQSLIAIQPAQVLNELETLLPSKRRINAGFDRQNILDG
ncbi:ADP-heptose--LPS heptosyltransferase [Sodalis-like endosymbiont of Proechinophthirus fluctus]|uniref:ADP-heptose--LPS heptosyltransferase RfaF n=1 Tax=Sodalis-like endosymbiont of Proechinophthirus fluctus TaxID=1462730 RepID=UPI0007A8AFA8|nr:ADP-heptose--LPS heptosyltransferase RfaF [Sodalis-like endosymbiont of Proechinophthirus fluctus]KYP95943.1 ADP-heptose--LPS heptosyltransferase [Sodalis-like endosymbiont of Proechinophthirus fluctus]